MIRRHRSELVLILLALALSFEGLIATSISAQVATGTPPFGSLGGGPDVINLANLNSHITIPVLHKAGRGTNFSYDLSYDSSVWYASSVNGVQTWTPVYNWGWRGQTEIATGYISYNLSINECWYQLPHQPMYRGYEVDIYSNFVYHDPWGASHPFAGSERIYIPDTPGANCIPGTNRSLTALATDGSGLTLNADANTWTDTITSPNGNVISPPLGFGSGSGTATDRNGNQISVTSAGVFTDTLGTTALSVSGSGTPTSPTVFTYTPPNTSSSRCASTNTTGVACYTMSYTNYTVATNFGVS